MNQLILAAVVALPLALTVLPTQKASASQVRVNLDVGTPVRPVLVHRVWIPGHWVNTAHARVWVAGHYE